MISPCWKFLLVAEDTLNCFSKMKPIRAFVDRAPIISYEYYILSANIYEHPYVKTSKNVKLNPYWISGVNTDNHFIP
jgi:hypothetical protein